MTRYYKMMDDVHVPGRWYLTDPTDRQGRKLGDLLIQSKPLRIDGPIRLGFSRYAQRGKPVDYCELSAEVVPVVHGRVVEVFTEHARADVQVFPAEIEGQPDQFWVVNITRKIKCIDEGRSERVELYTSADGELFAHRIGEYQSVRGLRIDPTKVGDAKVFRPWGWHVAVIVSEEIKQALEQIGTEGVRFEEV
jgi:hypothetical protein